MVCLFMVFSFQTCYFPGSGVIWPFVGFGYHTGLLLQKDAQLVYASKPYALAGVRIL
jgi:hypothetical protein